MNTRQQYTARPCIAIVLTACRSLLLAELALFCVAQDPVGWITGSAPAGSASAVAAQPLPAGESAVDVDLGLFARVVTSDPSRYDGAKAGRLEEFPAQDVFFTTQLAVRSDATYGVPIDPVVGGVIGLEWPQRRVLQRLELECVSPRSFAAEPVLEYWSSSGREDSWGSIGQTPWQGRWEPLPTKMEVNAGRWVATIQQEAVPEFQKNVGVLKIRWRFRGDFRSHRHATTGLWEFRLATRIIAYRDREPSNVTIDVYNGLLVDSDAELHVSSRQAIRASHGGSPSSAATRRPTKPIARCCVVNFRAARPVWRWKMCWPPVRCIVRDLGLLVSRADAPSSLAAHRQKIAGEQTILSRVREMPDQSLEQAMHALWRPAQNDGPTMLSLACDNAKFIVERDGAVRFGQLVLRPRFPLIAVELARLDFGVLGIDTTVRPSQATTPLPLSIADTTFQKGLGLHANAELIVLLEGRYEAFEAEVGVLSSKQPGGTVVFQVDVDGQRRYDSGIVRQGEAPRKIRVTLAGAQQLALHVTDAGDGILNDAANWARPDSCRPDPERWIPST